MMRHVGQARELGDGRLRPVERRAAVDLVALREQPAAEAEVLVAQDDARAGAAGGERRRQAGRAGADHQHVAEGVGLLVVVGIRRVGGAAEAGGAADQRLVELLPEARRPHEGLVVEAGAEERRRTAS